MNGNLFRMEALEAQKHRLHGDVLVLPSVKISVITIAIVAWVAAIGVWLLTSEYARKETVQGWLEPDKGVIRIFAESASGKIKHILVQEGDYVEKGQSLVIVNGDRVLQDGTHMEDQLLDEYQKQRDILNLQIERNQQIFQKRMLNIKESIRSIELENKQLEQQLKLSEARHQTLRQRVADSRQMQLDGHISKLDFDRLVSDEMTLRSDIAGLKRNLLSLQNERQKLLSELSIQPQEQQNSAAQIQNQLSEIAQRIAQLHGQRAHIIKATQNGYISNIQISQGQYTRPDAPLLTIVPSDSTIQARLMVPVRAAGFLESGQAVEMRYDAFPYQKFGLHNAKISKISKSAMLPAELNTAAVNVQEPVFVVWAELEKNWVPAFGQELSLKPGMTLSADIRLADRNLLEWLLEPLYSIKGKL